jgi:hypothetical protein
MKPKVFTTHASVSDVLDRIRGAVCKYAGKKAAQFASNPPEIEIAGKKYNPEELTAQIIGGWIMSRLSGPFFLGGSFTIYPRERITVIVASGFDDVGVCSLLARSGSTDLVCHTKHFGPGYYQFISDMNDLIFVNGYPTKADLSDQGLSFHVNTAVTAYSIGRQAHFLLHYQSPE